MGKVLEKYGHLGCNSYVCTTCSSTFLVVKCFDKKPHPTGKRFCTKKCWYAWKSKNVSAWNKGLAGKGICKPNSGSFKKGVQSSPDTQFKKGQFAGAKNNLWRGGICPLNALVRTSPKYKAWRTAIFKRDDYRCQECFKRGEKIHVDHIKTFASIMREFLNAYNQFSPVEDNFTLARLSESYQPFWDMENGRTLCVTCHKKTPSYLKR